MPEKVSINSSGKWVIRFTHFEAKLLVSSILNDLNIAANYQSGSEVLQKGNAFQLQDFLNRSGIAYIAIGSKTKISVQRSTAWFLWHYLYTRCGGKEYLDLWGIRDMLHLKLSSNDVLTIQPF